jgi:putative peptidoglycan lipid II flippase
MHGQFSEQSARLVSTSLGLFSLGMAFISLVFLIFRAFFSFQDTKTPTLIAVLSVSLSVALSFYFSKILQTANFFQDFIKNAFSLEGIESIAVVGLPLAVSIAAIFQFTLLMIFLYRRIGDFKLKEIFSSFLKILFAGLLMAFGVYLSLYLISPIFSSQDFLGNFWQLAIGGLVGALIYIGATFLLGSPEIKAIKSLIFGWIKR